MILQVAKNHPIKYEKLLNLCKQPWIPVATENPFKYPKSMVWYGTNKSKLPCCLVKLSEIYSKSFGDLVGSTEYIIHPSLDDHSLESLGVNNVSAVKSIIKHLK